MILTSNRQHFALGVDLGKVAETTAIAVVERMNPSGWTGPGDCPPEKAQLDVRHLLRFAPGTYYRTVSREIRELLQSDELAGVRDRTVYVQIQGQAIPRTVREAVKEAVRVDLIVDQTAVGDPVSDMILREAGATFARRVVLSSTLSDQYSGGLYRISKQTLVGGLEVLLETGRLKIAEKLASARQLVDELINYRGRKTPNVPQTADTWREQPSDDLVFAVALACWQLLRPQFSYEFLEVSW